MCSSLEVGGISPSIGLVQAICRLAKGHAGAPLPVVCLVRPRGGDFIYSEDEVSVMEADIREFAAAGCSGVVFGALTPNGDVAVDVNARLVRAAKDLGLSTTFHRAFDMSRDLEQSLKAIVELAFDRILTSGGEKSASEPRALARLAALRQQAGGRVVIMPGGGITGQNVAAIVTATQCVEVHSSGGWGRRSVKSAALYRPENGLSMCSSRPLSDDEWGSIDLAEVKCIKERLLSRNLDCIGVTMTSD